MNVSVYLSESIVCSGALVPHLMVRFTQPILLPRNKIVGDLPSSLLQRQFASGCRRLLVSRKIVMIRRERLDPSTGTMFPSEFYFGYLFSMFFILVI